jgi:hypothetical protein
MSAEVISLTALAFVFGGSIFGIYVRVSLPKEHLGGDSRAAPGESVEFSCPLCFSNSSGEFG